MAATVTQSKINFIKTNKSTVDTISSINTLVGSTDMVNSSIVANTANNYLAIAGTTFIPATPKFTDTTYEINFVDDSANDLVKVSLIEK